MKLTDICEFQGGSQPPKNEWSSEYKDGYIRMLQIRDFTQEERVTPEYVKITNRLRFCDEDDILIGRYGASVGKILSGKAGAYNVAIMKTIPNTAIVRKQYMKYYFLSPYFQSFILNLGGRAAQAGFSKDDLTRLEIDTISLEKQDEIIKELSALEEIIRIKCKQLKEFDDLAKSRFVELFGKENYPRVALIDLIAEGAGLSYGIVQPGNDGTGDMGVLRPVDMVDGNVSIASIKYIDRTIGEGYRKTELDGDELLITVRGTTGITALTDYRFKGMNVTRGIAVIRYDRSKVNPVYLNTYLNTDESQRYIQEHTRGATLKQINLSDLRIQPIMVPPLSLQKQMADFVEQTDKSKFVCRFTPSIFYEIFLHFRHPP